jgi:signal transduction histidine kinase/PAS domain-containing protein
MSSDTARPYKVLIAASLIIPIFLFLFTIWQDYNSILTSNIQEVKRTSIIFQQHALNVFETHQLVAERINDRIKDMSWSEIERSKELHTYLRNIEKSYPQVQAIWLADSSGIVRNASQLLPSVPVSVADRDYFKTLSKRDTGLFIGHIVKPHVMKGLNFNVAYRRGGRIDKFDGVIIVTVFPEYFSGFWDKVSSSKDSVAVLLRRDGSVLARAPRIDPNLLILPSDSEAMKAIRNSDKGSYIGRSTHDGRERVYSYIKLDKYDVYLVYGKNMQAVLFEWQRHTVYYGCLFSLAMFMLLLLAKLANKHAKKLYEAQEVLNHQRSDLDIARITAENERRMLEGVMEALPVGVAITDSRGGTVRTNTAFEKIWRGSRPKTSTIADYSAYKAWWADSGKPVNPEEWASAIAVMSGETVEGQVMLIECFDGTSLFVINSASPIRDSENNIIGCVVAISDITKLKRAEEELQQAHKELELRVSERTEQLATTIETLLGEITQRERAENSLQRLNSLYAVLSETNQAIVRAVNRDSLFQEFCRIAVEQGGFLLAWVGLIDDQTGEVRLIAASGNTSYLTDIRITANYEPTGEGPTGIAVRKGTFYICNDFQHAECTSPWHERGKAHGIYASASIALKVNDKVIGALTLYSDTKDFFDKQQEVLLLQMGADISFALDNLEREMYRQKAEIALHEETLERLRVVEALREKEQMLLQQSRLAAMGEMINNIAHQWRQPLNVLGLLLQQLQLFHEMGTFTKQLLDENVTKSMDLINHMSHTIDDFRNFFKPDKETVEFAIKDVVEKTVALVEDGFKSLHIAIHCNVVGNPVIIGFPNEFSQVLLNILINARDALLERSVKDATISILVDQQGEKSVVVIADNAGGIKEEIIGKIFDPYFTTKGPDQGTGVGLFMSKTIIEKNMKGSLIARNTPQGAEFIIEL